MSRLQILFVLLALVATPVLRLHCEHPCAPALATHAATDCHGSTNAPAKLVDGHDCSRHVVAAIPAVPVSPAGKETRSEFRFATTPVVVAAIGDLTALVVVPNDYRPTGSTRPPVPLAPLRI